jgi:hypothetical protein
VGPDEKSERILTISGQLLNNYGTAIDIIYEDPEQPIPKKRLAENLLLEPNSPSIQQKTSNFLQPSNRLYHLFGEHLYPPY